MRRSVPTAATRSCNSDGGAVWTGMTPSWTAIASVAAVASPVAIVQITFRDWYQGRGALSSTSDGLDCDAATTTT